MKKAPQAQAWRLSGKTFRPHTFTELQLEDSSNGFKNGSFADPSHEHGEVSLNTQSVVREVIVYCQALRNS
jgi:hypothetical protein